MGIREDIELLDQQLLAAAEHDELSAFKGALARGADINVTGKGGDTILHMAARKHDSQVLKFLLEDESAPKLDLEVRNDMQQTPLLAAFTTASAKSAELLLAHDADPTAVDGGGQNMLHIASHFPVAVGMAMLDIALRYDEIMDGTTKSLGYSPLHIMIETHSVTAVEHALLGGIDPRLKGDHTTMDPMELAQAEVNNASIEHLLKCFLELPRLVGDINDMTTEKLLEPHGDHGKRLIDNPMVWRKMDQIVAVLEAKGETLPSKADLIEGGIMTYPPFELAYRNGREDVAHHMLSSHGEKIEPEDLWDKDHQGVGFFGRTMCHRGLVAEMFTIDHWKDKTPQEAEAAYQALPPEAQETVNNMNQLKTAIQRSNTNQTRER